MTFIATESTAERSLVAPPRAARKPLQLTLSTAGRSLLVCCTRINKWVVWTGGDVGTPGAMLRRRGVRVPVTALQLALITLAHGHSITLTRLTSLYCILYSHSHSYTPLSYTHPSYSHTPLSSHIPLSSHTPLTYTPLSVHTPLSLTHPSHLQTPSPSIFFADRQLT